MGETSAATQPVTRALGVLPESALGRALAQLDVVWANNTVELSAPAPAGQRIACVVLRGSAGTLLPCILSLRDGSQWARTAIVCVVQAGEHNQAATCRRAGASFCFTEPVDARSVANVVRATLEQRATDWVVPVQTDQHAWSKLNELSFSVRSQKDAEAVATLLARACPQPARQALGISELLLNAVEHGNFEIDGASKQRLLEHGTFQAELERRMGSPLYAEREAKVVLRRLADRIELMVEDQGPGFDWNAHFAELDSASGPSTGLCGRGIQLTRTLAFDALKYVGRGNIAIAWVFTKTEPRPVSDVPLSASERRLLERDVDHVRDQLLDGQFFERLLEFGLRATGSARGFVAKVHEDGAIGIAAGTDAVQSPNERQDVLPQGFDMTWGGLWRTVLTNRDATFRNAEQDNASENALGVPIAHRGRLLGVIQVAGRAVPYEQHHAQMLEAMVQRLAPSFAARLSHDQANQRRAELEIRRSLELSEQELARRLVSGMLREGCLDAPGIRKFMSAKELFNGDLALASGLPDGTLRWMLGDFVGHGLTAAIGGLPVASVFYATARKGVPLSEVVVTINETLRATLPLGLFCSAVFLETSADGQLLSCWNAGMPNVLLRSGRSNVIRQIASHSLPLGIVAGAELDGPPREVPVAMGDRIVCMSDGVLETRGPGGELFGSDRVVESLSTGPANTAFDALLANLEAFRGPTAPVDDLSLIEVTVGVARNSGAPPKQR